MHNILNKFQQLNESTDVTEAEKKCKDCGKPISKCKCDDHDHKKDMKESVEARLLKEYAEFKKSKLKEEPNEGNEFSGALAQAKKDGKDKFEVDGEEYKVTEMFDKHDKVGTKKKTTHGTAEKTATGLKHTRDYKPDYLDIDGDGDKEEPMKKAAKDKKEKKA